MKFMTMVTTSNADEAGPPPPALFQSIGELGMKAGPKLTDNGGMKTVGVAKVEGGDLMVDGPYAEAKEAIGGFAMYELETEAEAVDWVKQFLELHRKHWPQWEGQVTLMQLINYGR